MGFFKDNASVQKFVVADDGAYTCRFKGIGKKQLPSFNDKNVLEDKFEFQFEATEEVDPEEGLPYKFNQTTGTSYGPPKAGLTIIIDGMVGRHLTDEEFEELDLADLKRSLYRVVVTTVTTEAGNQRNKIVSVKPVAAKKAKVAEKPKPEPEEDADEDGDEGDTSNDPFAE